MGGYQQLVRGEVMRGKFRNSFEKPEPFEPGQADEGRIRRCPTCSTRSARGHRIMVQVQSTWFPLVDRNPQTFVDIYTAKEADFKEATQRVYRLERRGVAHHAARARGVRLDAGDRSSACIDG